MLEVPATVLYVSKLISYLINVAKTIVGYTILKLMY